MSKIKLVDTGWNMIPEGQYTLKITDVEYDSDFGKLEVKMTAQSGHTHNERYTLIRKNGEANEGAIKAFSFFAKTALNNFDIEEIDPSDLVGCYVSAEVEHVESDTVSEKTGEPFVNVRLNKLKSEVGFKEADQWGNTEPVDIDLSELDDLLD